MSVEATVRDAVDGVADEPIEVKAAVGAAAATATTISHPPENQVGVLWRILVSALAAVLVMALAGIIWTVVDGKDSTSPEVIVTIFSSALTGLIGLFVRSPR
jgi:hypothetical protein